jgi:hypothetical protein
MAVKQENEAAKGLEGNDCGFVEVLFQNFHARAEENHEKIPVREEVFPNTSLERYRCVNQSGYYYYYYHQYYYYY